MPMRLLLICATLTTLLASGQATAAYITDKVIAPLFEAAQGEGKPSQVLSTGMPVNILKSEGNWTKIRTADGSEGWVEQIYITEEKPARSAVIGLQGEKRELQQRLQQIESDLADTHALLNEQQALVKVLTLNLESVGANPMPETVQLTSELPMVSSAEFTQMTGNRTQVAGLHVPYWVYALVGTLLVIFGMVTGVALMDAKQRRRHGGFRI